MNNFVIFAYIKLNKAEKKVIINVPEKFRNFFKLIIKKITGKLLLYYLYNYIIDFNNGKILL